MGTPGSPTREAEQAVVLLSPGRDWGVLRSIRAPHCKGTWRAWIKAQKPIRSLENQARVRGNRPIAEQPCRSAGRWRAPSTWGTGRRGRGVDAEMALWHSGAGRAPSPQLSKKGRLPCPRGDKGTAQQGREISRCLRLREHTSDVKKPSIRREALRGVGVPV